MNDDAATLQREIRAGIPLSAAMGFEITQLGRTDITIAAPLSPNLNVHSTGFAGSLYALGILTGWGMVHHLIRQQDIKANLVVAEATIRYRSPVHDDIECRCVIPQDQAASFVEQIAADGRARLQIEVSIGRGGEARLTADMAAKQVAD